MSESLTKQLLEALESDALDKAASTLVMLDAPDIAEIIENVPPKVRISLWQLIKEIATKASILHYLNLEVRTQFLQNLIEAEENVILPLKELEIDDLADVVKHLPEDSYRELLFSISDRRRLELAKALDWPEDTAGGVMNFDQITIRENDTVKDAISKLKKRKKIPHNLNYFTVVNQEGCMQGVVFLHTLLHQKDALPIKELMENSIKPLPALASQEEIVSRFEKSELSSLPVVDDKELVLGRITVDDVIEIALNLRQVQTPLLNASSSETSDIFAPISVNLKKRMLWLGINLITVFIAAMCMNLFKPTLEKWVFLAIVLPIVASTAGIGGMQSLSVMIRSMASDKLSSTHRRWIIYRELVLGGINALFLSVVIALLVYLFFSDIMLSAILVLATSVNLVIGALTGTLIPLLLEKTKIDAAVSGGVILTTITDVMSILVLLGLGSLVVH